MSGFQTLTLARLLSYAGQAALLFAGATFVFDCIHYVLHQLLRSRFALLRAVGGLHQAHHDFFTEELRLDDRHLRANLLKHVLPEYATQLAVTSMAFLFLDGVPVLGAVLVETVLCVATLILRGKDPNHRELKTLSAPPHSPLVTPAYHAGHHVFPETNFGSYTPLFDRLMGTGTQLKGRRVVITGASGAFGAPLKALIERAGVASVKTLKYGTDYTYGDYSKVEPALKEAEILILAHGSKKDHAMQANCDSFIALIERFKAVTAGRRVPPEIWAVGSEIEAHPAFGNADLRVYLESKRAFARHARRYYYDRSIVYRHIVPSAFRSRMGPGLISGDTAARIALFFVRRGFRYVPVTYTGIALVNYVKFLLRIHEAPAPGTEQDQPVAGTPVVVAP